MLSCYSHVDFQKSSVDGAAEAIVFSPSFRVAAPSNHIPSVQLANFHSVFITVICSAHDGLQEHWFSYHS